MTLTEVVDSIYTTRLRRCLVPKVEKRGVNFEASPTIIGLLKQINAPEEVLRAIKPPPEPPKPKFAGPLTVACEPGDCYVVVNNRYFGLTEKGRKVVTGLEAGEGRILVWGPTTETEARPIELQADVARSEKFELRLNTTMRRQAGRELLNRAINALGGVEAIANLADDQGDATATFKDSGQQQQEWTMRFWEHWEALSVNFKNSKGECTATVSSGSPEVECKGKLKNSSAEGELARIAQLFARSQVSILGRLLTRNVTQAAGPDQTTFVTEDGPDSYRVKLEEGGLPAEITHRSKPDGPMLHIVYSNYNKAENGVFPGRVSVTETPEAKIGGAVYSITAMHARPVATKKGR